MSASRVSPRSPSSAAPSGSWPGGSTRSHELGADGMAFPTIVASGPAGAQPHASTGDRVIEAGTTVVVDAAAKLGDYCSDCTRTFATGELPGELARSYEICLRAQEAALATVRPDVRGADVDAV